VLEEVKTNEGGSPRGYLLKEGKKKINLYFILQRVQTKGKKRGAKGEKMRLW